MVKTGEDLPVEGRVCDAASRPVGSRSQIVSVECATDAEGTIFQQAVRMAVRQKEWIDWKNPREIAGKTAAIMTLCPMTRHTDKLLGLFLSIEKKDYANLLLEYAKLRDEIFDRSSQLPPDQRNSGCVELFPVPPDYFPVPRN